MGDVVAATCASKRVVDEAVAWSPQGAKRSEGETRTLMVNRRCSHKDNASQTRSWLSCLVWKDSDSRFAMGESWVWTEVQVGQVRQVGR